MINNNFYSSIEEGVREIIYRLRNAGINTLCSCHHEGYIQATSNDAENEINTIFSTLVEMGINEFKISLNAEYNGNNFHRYLLITSPNFKPPV